VYDLILFDLDGTLTDPKLGITKSVQYALAKFGIDETDLDSLTKFIGPPLANSFQEYYLFEENVAQQAIGYYREYYSEYGIYENQLYYGIPALLEQLTAQKKELMVATSKPTVFAERVLKNFNIFDYFSSVVGSNLDGTRVNKAEIIECVVADLNPAQRRNVVMIGDRKYDIIGAKANQIDSIGVTYGYGSNDEIRTMEPTFIIDTVAELSRLLCAIPV
jgi:phosphoglycolate phosphatase